MNNNESIMAIFGGYNALKGIDLVEANKMKKSREVLLRTYLTLINHSVIYEEYGNLTPKVRTNIDESMLNDFIMSRIGEGKLKIRNEINPFEKVILDVIKGIAQIDKIYPKYLSNEIRKFLSRNNHKYLDNWLLLQVSFFCIDNKKIVWEKVINILFIDPTYEKYRKKWNIEEAFAVKGAQLKLAMSDKTGQAYSSVRNKLSKRIDEIKKKLKEASLPERVI